MTRRALFATVAASITGRTLPVRQAHRPLAVGDTVTIPSFYAINPETGEETGDLQKFVMTEPGVFRPIGGELTTFAYNPRRSML